MASVLESDSPMNTPVSACPRHDSGLANAVAEFCTRNYSPPDASVRESFPSLEVWRKLQATGTELWLDTGDVDAISELWTKEFVALTTNNTLLNMEVQKGIYDALVPDAAKLLRSADEGMTDDLLVQEIAFILNAVHGLTLVEKFDSDVSVELHTNLAWDTDASYQYGKRFAAICPDRFIVKVPLTPEGLFAARKLHNDGIRINFTLGFSARENYLIAAVARPDWVNVFMGRCNSFVSEAGLGDGTNIGEKATLASQRALRQLRDSSGIDVRQIGASMRGGQQAYDLMGLDVYTMPTGVAKAYLERDPEAAEVHDRTSDDPEVTPAEGRSFEEERVDTFWAVTPEMESAMCALLGQDLDSMTGAELRTFLNDHGVGDIFPELTEDDRGRVSADGKIPKYDAWADRVKAGTASWDGMLSEAALASFTTDQSKLDDRIRQHL